MGPLVCRGPLDPNPHGCKPNRAEYRSQGFDDFLQLIGGDAEGTASSTGLRVPNFVAVYRFLVASVELAPGMSIKGMRLGIWIADQVPEDEDVVPPFYLERRPVVTDTWRFQDNFYAFTLTMETKTQRSRIVGPSDMDSFMFLDCDSPCLLYDTAGFPTAPTSPGYLGLNAYTAPAMIGRPIKVFKDIPFPWQSNEFLALDICAEKPERWRLYCDVLQTDPNSRPTTTIPASPTAFATMGVVPEELFLQLYGSARVHQVAAAFIVEGGLST